MQQQPPPPSYLSLPPLVVPNGNEKMHGGTGAASEGIGDWLFKLGGATSSFGRTSWKKRFVVADPVGIFYFPQQENFTAHSMHKAKGFRLYRSCESFVTCFASDPEDVGLTSLTDPETKVSLFHSMACEPHFYYFGFVVKNADVNPVFLLRTDSKATRDKFVTYIASCFNPPRIRPMLLPPRMGPMRALPSDEAHTTVSVGTSPQELAIALSTLPPRGVAVLASTGVQTEMAQEIEKSSPPALADISLALTVAHEQITRLMDDVSRLNRELEASNAATRDAQRHVAALEAQRDMKSIPRHSPRGDSKQTQCDSIPFASPKWSPATPTPAPSVVLDDHADATITALRQKVARVTLERDSLQVSVQKLHTKFESCLSVFCEKVLQDMETLSSETRHADDVWRERLRKAQRDHVFHIDDTASSSHAESDTLISLRVVEDDAMGGTLKAVVAMDKGRLRLCSVDDRVDDEETSEYRIDRTWTFQPKQAVPGYGTTHLRLFVT